MHKIKLMNDLGHALPKQEREKRGAAAVSGSKRWFQDMTTAMFEQLISFALRDVQGNQVTKFGP